MLWAIHRWLLSHPGRVVLVAALSLLPMGWWSAELFGDLRADVRELLPTHARSVETLKQLEKRFGGWSQLSIIVESKDRQANRRFSDDLVAELAKLKDVRSARNKLGAEKAFFEAHWQLFVDLEDLQLVEQRISTAAEGARKKANPLLVDLDDEPETHTATAAKLDFSDLEEKYKARLSLAQQFPEDYFESKDGTDLAVIVRRRGLAFGIHENKRLVANVREAIQRLGPASYATGMVVGLGGDVMNLIDENDALEEDLALATLIVTVLIMIVIVGYYRRWRALYMLGLPILVGAAWTFGLSHFLIGYLNASSAFLATIVPGNGINIGLILLARYIEERRSDRPIEEALHTAVRFTASATSTAAAAAAISYGSLIATDFLGFKHFGIIGGIGMVLCWISTFAVLPSLILAAERRWPLDPHKELHFGLPPGALPAIPAKLVLEHPRLLATLGVVSGLAALGVSVMFLRDPFEKDFYKLRSKLSVEGGSASWEAKVDQIFGRYLSPQVILAEHEEDVPQIVDALAAEIKAGGERSPLTDVSALSSLVPRGQEEKLLVLQRIRKLLSDDLLDNLSASQRKLALRYRPAAELGTFTSKDLPESIRADFRELDGREGLVVLALPNLKLNLYHADEIARVAAMLRRIQLPDGRVVESSGNFVVYSDMVEAVAKDGPKATLLSFFGVLILAMLVFRRPIRIGQVAGSLVLGVLWLGAAMALLDLKINFLNFIALPITFGIGLDYAVNIYARNLLERRGVPRAEAVRRAMISTGGAVVLCSMTTIIGYASLLVARNGALVSFGRAAILGEFTCLGAALLILPAWLVLIRDPDDPPER